MSSYRSASAAFSFITHGLIIILFLLVKTPAFIEQPEEPIEVGFGPGFGSGGGGAGSEINPGTFSEQEAVSAQDKSDDIKDTKSQTANDEAIKTVSKSDKKSNNSTSASGETEKASGLGTGKGTAIGPGEGDGLGFSIDWGGGGKRKILYYPLPGYPKGSNKQLDVKIRFSILPDGTVGARSLLTKGDTMLENAALNAIQLWRFEQLAAKGQSFLQSAVIVFQFRLR